MCVGVRSLENPFQLSGWTRVLTESRVMKPTISSVIARSFARISPRKLDPSATSLEEKDGDCRCSSTMWIAIKRTANTANAKWRAVKRRKDQEVTVADPNTNPTTSSPKIGSTVNKFKITSAAQYDIFPETTT